MAVFHNLKALPPEAKGAVVAIGNFDGVHRGHQAVIAQARKVADALASSRASPLAVLSFEPHPRSYFHPDRDSFRLTPMVPKARALEMAGIDHIYIQDFTADFATLSATAFVEEILVKQLGARHLVVGEDFCFGQGRRGNLTTLRQAGGCFHFGVTSAGVVCHDDGKAFSSSLIRQALVEGKPREAAVILGREWEIDGVVQRGFERGRTIGFPTANLSMEEYLLPRLGVYAVRVAKTGIIEGAGLTHWYHGVANIGKRPTVDGEAVNLEVFVFDFEEDLYGVDLRVRIVDFIRPEMKFNSLGQLKEQIRKDGVAAKAALAKAGKNL